MIGCLRVSLFASHRCACRCTLRREPLKTITLRNIPSELAQKLEEKARAQGVSLTTAAIEVLEQAMGLRRRKQRVLHHDLDSLAGTSTEEEARVFEKSLRNSRRIDRDPRKSVGAPDAAARNLG